MGAITAVHSTGANIHAKRQNGMQLLGERIRMETAPPPPAIPPKTDVEYAEALFNALEHMITSGHELYYEFNDGGATMSKRITKVRRKRKRIFCRVAGGRALVIRVSVEEERFGDDFFTMDVIFPEDVDKNNYTYIDQAAGDVLAINHQGNGAKYLAAFKFLSRCA